MKTLSNVITNIQWSWIRLNWFNWNWLDNNKNGRKQTLLLSTFCGDNICQGHDCRENGNENV